MPEFEGRNLTFRQMQREIFQAAADAYASVDKASRSIQRGLELEREVDTIFAPLTDTSSQSDILGLFTTTIQTDWDVMFAIYKYMLHSLRVQEELGIARGKIVRFGGLERAFPATPSYINLFPQWEETEATVQRNIAEIEAENPLYTPPEGLPTFTEIAEMKKQLDTDGRLSDENIRALDALFTSPSETLDIVYVIFLFLNATVMKEEFKSNLLRDGFPQSEVTKAGNVYRVLDRYITYYYYRCIDATFSPDDSDELPIPPSAELLSMFIALLFTDSLKMLPTSFNTLLEDGLVPGLSEESMRLLKNKYEQRFNTQFPQAYTEYKDGDNAFPYRIAQDTALAGRWAEAFGTLEAAFASQPQQEVPSDTIDVLKQRYPELRAFLGNKVHTIGTWGDIRIDVASYSDFTIDFIFITPNNIACALHVDGDGRLIGIPSGYEEQLLPIAETALARLLAFVDEKKGPRVIVPPTPGVKPPKAPPPGPSRTPAVPRPLPVGEHQPHLLPTRPLKRKAARRLELDGEETTPAPLETPAIAAEPVEVLETDRFQADRKRLPLPMQQLLGKIMVDIQSGKKKGKKFRHKEFGDYSGSVYVVRFSSYRLVLVETDDKKLHAISVKHGHDAYDEIVRLKDTIIGLLQEHEQPASTPSPSRRSQKGQKGFKKKKKK